MHKSATPLELCARGKGQEWTTPGIKNTNVDYWPKSALTIEPALLRSITKLGKKDVVRPNWKDRVLNSFRELTVEPEFSDLAEVVKESLFRHAEQLIKWLPIEIDAPCVGLDVDGGILFEWYINKGDAPTMVSIITKDESVIYSVLKSGEASSYGVINFSYDSVHDIVIPLVEKYFGGNKNG